MNGSVFAGTGFPAQVSLSLSREGWIRCRGAAVEGPVTALVLLGSPGPGLSVPLGGDDLGLSAQIAIIEDA